MANPDLRSEMIKSIHAALRPTGPITFELQEAALEALAGVMATAYMAVERIPYSLERTEGLANAALDAMDKWRGDYQGRN